MHNDSMTLFFADHRFPVQSDDFDDGVAINFAHHFTANDERSGDEKRNGKYEFE